MRVFVDTGVWFELNAGDDRRIARLVEQLGTADELCTSTPVLAELWNLLTVRRSPGLATEACLDIAASTTVLHVEPADHEHALAVMRAWPDQSFSYTDATSFLLMVREGIDIVASFDVHFHVFRHGPDRRRAFQVLTGNNDVASESAFAYRVDPLPETGGTLPGVDLNDGAALQELME